MAAVVTSRVRRADLARLGEDTREQLPSALDSAVSHLRPRYSRQPAPVIEIALMNELRRATGGRVVERDLPLAATAIHRGDYLSPSLVVDS